MYGFLIFNDFLNSIGERCRNKLLGNIFDLVDVTVSDLVLRNNCVIFRLFSDGVFYQYVFDLNNNNCDYFIRVSCDKNIIDKVIYVNESFKKISLLVKIFKSHDEDQIYHFLKKLL